MYGDLYGESEEGVYGDLYGDGDVERGYGEVLQGEWVESSRRRSEEEHRRC